MNRYEERDCYVVIHINLNATYGHSQLPCQHCTGTTRDQHKGRCCCNNSQDICSLAFSSNLTIFDIASTSTEKRFLYIIVNNPIQEPIVIIWNNLIAHTNKITLFCMGWLLLAIFLLPIKIFYWPQKVLWGRWIQNIHQQQRESNVQNVEIF